MTKPWLGLSIVVGLVFMLTVPAWADFQAGLDAYERGDYKAALKEFRLAAEQGDAQAQFKLGVMYDEGQGVAQDYEEAARWFRLAAEQGHALAQNNLGVVYGKGQGVKQEVATHFITGNVAAIVALCDTERGNLIYLSLIAIDSPSHHLVVVENGCPKGGKS